MAELDLGGIRLSDTNGSILAAAFLTVPSGGEERNSNFRGDQKLFVGVIPVDETKKDDAVLLEVQDGKVSYTTKPGQIKIEGTFYATQPSNLARGERFIYKGSLLLPIKTLENEDRTSTKGYEITSLASGAIASDVIYIDPKRGLTFSSGGTTSKPSLRVDGELVLASGEDAVIAEIFSQISGASSYNVVYRATGKTEEQKPLLNIGRTFNIPIFLTDYKLEVEKADVQFGPFDSRFGIRLGGDFKLKSKENPKEAFGGRLKIVTPDNFLQLGGSGNQLKGSFELSNIPLGSLQLRKASAKGDTKDFSTFEFAADIGLSFNPAEAFGFKDEDPKTSFGATFSLLKGKFDTLVVNVKGIKIPLGSTPFVATGFGGGIKDLGNTSVRTKVVLQTSFETITKSFDDPVIKGDAEGEISLENLGIKGKIEVLPGFKVGTVIKGFGEIEGKTVLDWNKGILSGNVKTNFFNEFLTGRIDYAVDTNLNFSFLGQMNVKVPRTIPLVGGKNLGQSGAGFQYINNDKFSNSFAAAWFVVETFIFGRKEVGAKFVFKDREFKLLGADSIAETRGTLDNTIGLIAKGDLDKSISTTTLKSAGQPPQTKRFLPVRFDRSEFNFRSSLNIFEPIARGINPGNRIFSFATKNGKEYNLPSDAVFLSDVAESIPELSTPESSFYVVDLDKFKQKTGIEFKGFGKVAPEEEGFNVRFLTPVDPEQNGVFRLDAELFKITESPDITVKELKEKFSPRPKQFIPVRFDRSELSFQGSPDRFEPIATGSELRLTPGIDFYTFNAPRQGFSTKNNRQYVLPLDAVFLSDVAQPIPELSTPESSFYLLDLDLFRRKTGREFKEFAKVLPAEVERFFIADRDFKSGLRRFFPLKSELFNTTDDITLKELKEELQPKAVGSQPLAEGLLAGAASPNLFSMLTVDRGNKVDIAYDASDPDSEANITFYYDSDGSGANGIFITDGLKEKDGTDTYTWDTADVPAGTYYIYAVINDGDNVPVVSYLPDPIRILDPNVLPQVQAVTGEWSGSDTVDLTWEPLPDLGLGYYVVSYTSIASGDLNQEESGNFTSSISDESSIRLTGLQIGDYYRFTVKAVNEAGEEGLPSEPMSILVGDRYTASLEKGEWEFSTHPGSEYIADLALNQDQQAVLLRGPAGASIKEGRFIWEVPVDADLGIYDVSIQILDVFGNESVLDRLFEVNDREIPARLLQANDSVFTVQGTNAKLEVTAIAPSSSKFVNELGIFIVDDVKGRINGLQPLDAGYLAAAVRRSQVVFSLLTDNPPAFEKSDYSRLLSFEDDTNVRFLLVKDSSLDDVRDGQVPLSSVLLPTVNTNTVTKEGNGQFKLQWEDGSGDPTDFQDLVIQIKATDRSLLLGDAPQTQTCELFNFTDVTVPGAKVVANLDIYQSLAFDNVLGFYEVLNTEGAILDALTGQVLRPGIAGYETAAVSQRVASLDVVVNRVTDTQGIVHVQSEFSAGKQYAPFVIVNGLPEQLLDANTDKKPEIYFSYLGYKVGSFDRFRLLGQNVFAFEDSSDRDFNDIVIKGQFSVLS